LIDHILRFADEATAQQHPIAGRYWSSEGGWRQDFIIPGVSVSRVTRVVDGVETRVPISGWFMLVSLGVLSPQIRDIAAQRCLLILDRDDGVRRRQFARFVAADITPEIISTIRIEPTFAGSNYRFGA
jgi:hypothetical protein